MPKFACRCGDVIDLVETPAPEELLLVPETAIEEIAEMVEEKKLLDSEAFYDVLDRDSLQVIRCPKCGRMHVQETRDSKVFISFAREVERHRAE
jgi:hypothetical protein